MALDDIQMHILQEVADLHTIPEGAYNIRSNGSLAGRNTTANIDITSKPDGTGIDIQARHQERKRAYSGGSQRKRPEGRGLQRLFHW